MLNSYLKVERSSHNLPLPINCQEEILCEDMKFSDLRSSLDTALHNWLLNKKNPLFGYLLISTAPYKTGGDHSCVLLESSLMRQIRQFVYDRKFMGFKENREIAIIIHAFLGPTKNTFIKLFPQYQKVFDILTEIQNNLVEDILKLEVKEENLIENPIDPNVINYLGTIVRKKITINKLDVETSKKHILGIINNSKHINSYISLYIKKIDDSPNSDYLQTV
jgi:hypothetical protein